METEVVTTTNSPLASFIYALNSPAARREYPKRLKIFLKSIGMPGRTVEEQAAAFLAKNDIQFYRVAIIIPSQANMLPHDIFTTPYTLLDRLRSLHQETLAVIGS